MLSVKVSELLGYDLSSYPLQAFHSEAGKSRSPLYLARRSKTQASGSGACAVSCSFRPGRSNNSGTVASWSGSLLAPQADDHIAMIFHVIVHDM